MTKALLPIGGLDENRAIDRIAVCTSASSWQVSRATRNHLDEGSVQENVWFGLWGELAQRAIAERPPETWLAAYHK